MYMLLLLDDRATRKTLKKRTHGCLCTFDEKKKVALRALPAATDSRRVDSFRYLRPFLFLHSLYKPVY